MSQARLTNLAVVIGACVALVGCKPGGDTTVCLDERELGVTGEWMLVCRTERAGMFRIPQWRVLARDAKGGAAYEVLLVRAAVFGGPGAPVLEGGRIIDEKRSYEICVEGNVVIANRHPTLVLLR